LPERRHRDCAKTSEPFDDGGLRDPGQLAVRLIEAGVLIARRDRCSKELGAVKLAAVKMGASNVFWREGMLPRPINAQFAEQCLDDVIDVMAVPESEYEPVEEPVEIVDDVAENDNAASSS